MDVTKFLKEKGAAFEVIKHEEAFTAQEVAASEHVSGHVFAKTVVVKGGDANYMLVLPASRHADLKKAGNVIGAKLSLATEAEMKALFPDCEIGAEPPFGSQYGVQTFVDETMTAVQQIVFRAGTHARTVKMSCADYLRLEKAKVGAFTIEDE